MELLDTRTKSARLIMEINRHIWKWELINNTGPGAESLANLFQWGTNQDMEI